MKRVTNALVPALAVIGLVVAPATGAPRERTETVAYEHGSGAHLMDTLSVQVSELPEARPAAGEKTVSIVLEDETGRPVAGAVHQGKNVLGEICGATEAPLQLVGRQPVHVHVYAGPGCTDVSVPTTGTVTFTFAK